MNGQTKREAESRLEALDKKREAAKVERNMLSEVERLDADLLKNRPALANYVAFRKKALIDAINEIDKERESALAYAEWDRRTR